MFYFDQASLLSRQMEVCLAWVTYFLMGMNEVKAIGTHSICTCTERSSMNLTGNWDEFCCSSYSDKSQGPLIVLLRELEGSKSDCPEI